MRCLIHTGPGIGDIIQFLSMARAIKEQYPDSTVDLLMRGSDQLWKLDNQILECQDYADNLYWYSAKKIKHNLGLLLMLGKKHYDFGIIRIGNVDGSPSLWIYRIMRLAGCKKIAGFGTDKVDIKVEIPERTHYLKRNYLLLQAIGVRGRDNAVSINKDRLDNHWMSIFHIPDDAVVIGLSLGTNSMEWHENGERIVYDVKSWPYVRWFELAEKLSDSGCWVILVGGNKERKEVKEQNLTFPDNEKIVDLVGKTTIRQSLTILNRCTLLVGAEGGMMHCASALGIQTLTLFGGSDYKVWNPGGEDAAIVNLNLECAPCFCTSKGAHCMEHKCLMGISVRMVFKEIMRFIK